MVCIFEFLDLSRRIAKEYKEKVYLKKTRSLTFVGECTYTFPTHRICKYETKVILPGVEAVWRLRRFTEAVTGRLCDTGTIAVSPLAGMKQLIPTTKYTS